MLTINLNKNKLILLSLFSSLFGIFLIYIASSQSKPLETKIDEISQDLIGKTISTSGYIVDKKVSSTGHIFLTISQNKATIEVPLFKNFLDKMREERMNTNFRINQKIFVQGVVDEYKGKLQIIPRKTSDIKIIG